MSEDPTVRFTGYLASAKFDFYYEEYAENTELLDTEAEYDTVKKAFISRCKKPEPPEEKIQRSVSWILDAAYFSSSLFGMGSLSKKEEFDGKADLTLLRKAVMEHTKLSHFSMYSNYREYASLVASVLSLVLAREAFSAGSRSS